MVDFPASHVLYWRVAKEKMPFTVDLLYIWLCCMYKWGFPKIWLPPHHSLLDGIFHYKLSSYWGQPIYGNLKKKYIYLFIYLFLYLDISIYIYIYLYVYIYIYPFNQPAAARLQASLALHGTSAASMARAAWSRSPQKSELGPRVLGDFRAERICCTLSRI